jgi:hypothetical protein
MTGKGPGAFAVQQAMNALQQARERLLAIDPDIGEDQTLLADMLDGEVEGDPFAVIDRLVATAISAEDFAQIAHMRAAELAERKARFLRRSDRMRSIVKDMMDALSLTRLERPCYSAGIGKGQPELLIDEAELADEHMRITKTPDRKAIRKLLVDGEEVRGARLGNSMPRLTLRTR